jgi:hypothetical protein
MSSLIKLLFDGGFFTRNATTSREKNIAAPLTKTSKIRRRCFDLYLTMYPPKKVLEALSKYETVLLMSK